MPANFMGEYYQKFFWKKEILILYNLFQKIEKQEILTYSLKQQSWF